MKQVINLAIGLLVTINFAPCFAMEKEKRVSIKRNESTSNKPEKKSLIQANKPLPTTPNKPYPTKIFKLLKEGTDIDATDSRGNTALDYAMRDGNFGLIKFLFCKKANLFIENLYRNHPLLYLNVKTPPFEFMSIVTDITKQGITQQMRSTLEKLSIKIEKNADNDDITLLFNEKVSKRTEYIADFYINFLRQVSSFLLLALDERTEKTAGTLLTLHENTKKNEPKIQLDTSLPYFKVNEAQEKIFQLFQIIKMMNNVTFNFFKKQLILPKEIYNLHFDKANLHTLKSNFKTHKIYEYLFQLKTIIDNPILYRKEINNKITLVVKDYMAEKVKSSASFLCLVTLVEKDFYFPTSNKEEIIDYIKGAPPSKISSEWFGLAINTFAKMREFKENLP